MSLFVWDFGLSSVDFDRCVGNMTFSTDDMRDALSELTMEDELKDEDVSELSDLLVIEVDELELSESDVSYLFVSIAVYLVSYVHILNPFSDFRDW